MLRVIEVHKHKANKNHTCCVCKETIKPGDYYFDVTIVKNDVIKHKSISLYGYALELIKGGFVS